MGLLKTPEGIAVAWDYSRELLVMIGEMIRCGVFVLVCRCACSSVGHLLTAATTWTGSFFARGKVVT